MKQNILHSAFTLIELLVVVSLMSLFFFFAIAAYNNFNRGQTLSAAVKEFKAVLRDAQNRAMSGEKDPNNCTEMLYGWKVSWQVGSAYKLIQLCTDANSPYGPIEINTSAIDYTLPNTNGIGFVALGEIIFKPVNGMVEPAGGAILCITSNFTTSYKITISGGGDILEEKKANADCT